MDTENGSSAPYDEGETRETAETAPGPPPAASQPGGPEVAGAQAVPPPPPPPHPAWTGWHGSSWTGAQGYGQAGPGYPPAYGQGGPGYPPPPGQGGPGYPPAYGPAYGGPGGPGYPPAYGPAYGGPGGPGQHARPGRRRGLVLAAAGTALALAAGGIAWATIGSAAAPLSASTIASETDPGVVDIHTIVDYGEDQAWGTGMVLNSGGEVLTNNHVIAGATSIKVTDIGNGRTYTARVVGYSDTEDVAVLQLEGASGLTTVTLGSSSGLTAGQQVVALGNAEGRGGTPAVATGSITGLGAAITAEDEGDGALEHLSNMIQTNANIEPGDSGGPLVNASGQVVGMDTAASTDSGQPGTTADVTTTAFAIPISRALSIAGQIEADKATGTVHVGQTAFLGVAVDLQQNQSGGEPASGATIVGVIRATPAARAGMVQGDTITSIGGHEIGAASDLQGVIERYHPGDKVTVTWTDQSGASHTASVTMVAGPAG
jgi:S1-C subfamily serine protease